ncbi:hydrogenase iron-sulfur subunit [bacterium]|nr:hydrogenase iron-sulfur subunit [bacterium]
MNHFDALIVGSGFSGLSTAIALSKKNYSVLILENDNIPGGLLKNICNEQNHLEHMLKIVRQDDRITLITQAELKSVTGYYPDFSINWLHNGHSQNAGAGHIVFAMGVEMQFPMQLFPAGPRPGILTLPELETRICDGPLELTNKRILMVCGYQDHAPAYSMQLAMEQSFALAQNNIKVIFILPNVLLNNPDTAVLYRECRQIGVLFIRSDISPILKTTENSVSFQVMALSVSNNGYPALIHGSIDLAILEPKYKPRILPEIFWSPHHPSTGANGYYQPDNPVLGSILSERKGLYYVGAITGLKSHVNCLEEVALVVSEISVSVSNSDSAKHPKSKSYAEVDEHKCAACLTCVRICPHRAIHIEGTAQISIEACDACGICIAECPAKAIAMVHPDDYDLKSKIIPHHEPESIVLYCCDGSTWPTWNTITTNPLTDKWSLRAIRVPCSGNITISAMLEHFKAGISAILIAACQLSCCNHIHGNRLASNRVQRVKSILKSLGMDPGRIKMVHVAHGMDNKLIREIDTFCRQQKIVQQKMNSQGHKK